MEHKGVIWQNVLAVLFYWEEPMIFNVQTQIKICELLQKSIFISSNNFGLFINSAKEWVLKPENELAFLNFRFHYPKKAQQPVSIKFHWKEN